MTSISSVEEHLDSSPSQKDTLNVAKSQLTELSEKESKVKWQERLTSWVQKMSTKTGKFDADGCIEILENLTSEQKNWLLQTVAFGAIKAAGKNTAASTISAEEHFAQSRLKDLIEALLSSELLVGAIQDRAREAKDLLNNSMGDLLSRAQDSRERKERFDKEEQAYAEARRVVEAAEGDGIGPTAKEIDDAEGWNSVCTKEERQKCKQEAAAMQRQQQRQDKADVPVPAFVSLSVAYRHQALFKTHVFCQKVQNKTGATLVFRNSDGCPSGTRPASAEEISIVGSLKQCSGAIELIQQKLPTEVARALKQKWTTKRQKAEEPTPNFSKLNLAYKHQLLLFGKPLKQMQQDLGVSFVFYDSRDCPRGTRPDCKDVLAIVGDDAQIAAAIQR